MLILAGVLRLVWSHHVTFFINSLAHMWGSRPYTEENTARDNPVLAVLTYGEGYHNFHHIFTHDYRNGVRWWQWDPSKWLIGGLEFTGLTRRLKRTPVIHIQRALLTMQFNRAQARLAAIPAGGHVQLEALRGAHRARIRELPGSAGRVGPCQGRVARREETRSASSSGRTSTCKASSGKSSGA